MTGKTKVVKIPVLDFKHTQDVNLYLAETREDKAYLENSQVAQFENRAVFTVNNRIGKLPKKFKVILHLDGKADCCVQRVSQEFKEKIKAENEAAAAEVGRPLSHVLKIAQLEVLPDNLETLFEPLTFKDRVTVVKREIAKQLGKFKPMETWQFIVIIALVAAGIAVSVMFR